MHKSLIGLTGALLLAAQSAHAQLSSTVTVASDYDFRGVSLSAKDPALQASVDYAFSNGFAVGVWGSNIDSGPDVDGDIEVDLYGGYTGTITETLSWNTGLVWYAYPGSDDIDDYPEAYVGLAFGPFSLKQWFSHDFVATDLNGWYTEGNFTFALPANLTVVVHAGLSHGEYWTQIGGGELFDYSLGLGYPLGNFNLGLKLTGTDATREQEVTSDVFNNEPRVVFSVATTFPWGKD